MSHEASSWAMRQRDLMPGSKLLLLVLANAADKSGVAWIGRKTQAEDCCCRLATITENVKRLESAGLVQRIERRRANGSRTSDYTILAPLAADRGEMRDAVLEEHPSWVVAVARRPSSDQNGSGSVSAPRRNGSGSVYAIDQVRFSGGPDPLEELLVKTSSDDEAIKSPDEEEQVHLTVLNERVEAFLAYFRRKHEEAGGEPLPRWIGRALTLARQEGQALLAAHPDSVEIAAVLDFALADKWYADKIETVPKFRKAYPRIRKLWRGAEGRRQTAEKIAERQAFREPREVPAAGSVSYEGDRVAISP